jgi:hypothetical protein
MKIKFYDPTPPQQEFRKLINDPEVIMSYLVAGRQTGKTFCMMLEAITKGLSDENHRDSGKKGNDMFWVSPISEQGVKVMSQIDAMFVGREELRDQLFKRFDRRLNEIHFHNGGFLKFRSAEQGDSLRGATLDWIWVDEAAYMNREDFIEPVLLPMLTRTNGRITFASTYKGKNWFYKQAQAAMAGDLGDRIKGVQRTYLDLLDPSVEEFVQTVARPSMSKAKFDQEYLCKPVDASALFSNVGDLTLDVKAEDAEKIYVGIDVGIVNDYTVITGINEKGQMCYLDRFNYKDEGLSWDTLKERIQKPFITYRDKIKDAYFEINGNDALFDDLIYMDGMDKLIEFKTNAESKATIIEQLIVAFERAQITIHNDMNLIVELESFVSKQNRNTGRTQYGNGSGADHDDMVMSLAIAYDCFLFNSEGGFTEFMK